MSVIGQKSKLFFIFGWVLFSAFLMFSTGIIGDDYSVPYFQNHLHITVGPVNYLIREGFYKFAESGDYIFIDLIKFIVITASMLGSYKFFNLFHGEYFSALLAFAFVYFPVHDGVTYWYTWQGYVFCCALYFYAYVLLTARNYLGAIFFALLASFMGYGSPPFALGLAYLAYRQFGYRSSFLILLPNVLYVFYYFIVTKVFGVGIDRVSNGVNIFSLFKNFLMQMGTAVDALLGPSAWFKIYYSIMELSLVSIGVVLVFWFFVLRRIRYVDVSSEVVNKDVVGAFFVTTMVSWVMFASTGFYPQTSFNLGDRVTLWGALLSVYVIFNMVIKNKVSYILGLAILVLSITGISEHWKNWHFTQKNIIHNIKNNVEINSLNKDTVVFVSGHGYSKLGSFSHLEFFSIESYASSIFRHSLGRPYNLRVIYVGDNLSIDDDFVVHRGPEELVKGAEFVNFYDSKEDKFSLIKISEFKNILNSYPGDQRHWIQIYGCGALGRFIDVIAPRYKYLCAIY
jgi:hypothetical protein